MLNALSTGRGAQFKVLFQKEEFRQCPCSFRASRRLLTANCVISWQVIVVEKVTKKSSIDPDFLGGKNMLTLSLCLDILKGVCSDKSFNCV